MNYRRLVLAALVFLQGCFLFAGAPAQTQIYTRKAVERHILRFEFEAATHLLSACTDPYAKAYYLNHMQFMRVFASDDPIIKEKFYQSCDQSLQVFDKMPKTSSYRKYYQGEVYFLRGVVNFLSKKYLAAGMDMRSSYSRIKSNTEEFPAFRANYKLMGLFEAGLSAVPENYRYITNLLGYSGDLMRGMDKMRIAAHNSELFPEESQMLLCYAQRKLMDDTDLALKCVRELHQSDSDNILYTFFLANIAVNNKRSAEALKYLGDIEKWQTSKSVFYIQFLHYLRGKAYFYTLQYDKALLDLNHFIRNYKGNNFVVDALFKRALIYELKGDHTTARTLFLEITKLSKNDFDMDNYAIRYAPVHAEKAFTEEEKTLQKARNLFDGGLFEESSKILMPLVRDMSELSDDVALELNYRMGRIYQEKKDNVRSRNYYLIATGNRTLKTHPTFWMKVYSIYYVGSMYEDEGKLTEAVKYYKLALTHKDYLHQNDLEQMARSGLDRLKKVGVSAKN
jgi:tetratricopeptide (TPR) repeat protein